MNQHQTHKVLAEVAEERHRQDLKFPGDLVAGHDHGTDGLSTIPEQRSLGAFAEQEARQECEAFKDSFGVGSFALILDEEIAEANAATTEDELRKELIQVAAVAVKWVEFIDASRARDQERADLARCEIEARSLDVTKKAAGQT